MPKSFFAKLTGGGKKDFEEETENTPQEEPELKVTNREKEEKWLGDERGEGQLSVDVYQTGDNLIIKSTIAGVKPEDLDISISGDMITIRGERRQEEKVKDEDYFYQECYWGNFSRSIILPVEVKPDQVEAVLRNGVLTVTLPKAEKSKSVAIKVKSE